jgi:hypothetical protein
MNQRDCAAKLAKTDSSAALKLALGITEVRERIQSLGWVARYAPAKEIARVVAMATKSAGTSSDFYADTMALAWPLRALHETGNGDSIPPLLKTALSLSADVRPASSRAEAVGLLIHAVLPDGLRTVEPAIVTLKSVASDAHWRVVGSLVDTALLVNALDRQSALNVAHAIPAEKKRNSTVKRISDGETLQPRSFFW